MHETASPPDMVRLSPPMTDLAIVNAADVKSDSKDIALKNRGGSGLTTAANNMNTNQKL